MPSFTALLVAAVAGQVSAATVGILAWPLLPVTAGLLLLAAQAGDRADKRRAVLLKRVAASAAIALTLLCLPRIVGVTDPQELKGSLGLLLVGVQVCQALGWGAVRERRVGAFTALGVLVLAASYAPDVLVGLPLVVGWVALLIALGQLQGSSVRQLLPATGVAVVLALVAFLLIPVPAATGVRSRLAGAAGTAPSASPSASRSAAGALAFSSDTLDLRSRGGLSEQPVLRVPASSPVLWRGTTFDQYNGSSWSRPPTARKLTRGPTHAVGAVTGKTRTDRAELLVGSVTVWSPGLITSVTATGEGGSSIEAGELEVRGLRGSYEVTSLAPVTDPDALRGRRGSDETDSRWRSLPPALPSRVRALAEQLTSGSTSRWDAAEAVAGWLRTHATYRLDSPVPAPGQDAVDRFLFVDRTGFCEQFASAEAVLLRAAGIPARLVTGLAYGSATGGQRLYRNRDLHAWVELWVPGSGWVSSDPTAGVSLAAGSSTESLRSRTAAAVTRNLRRLTQVPGGKPTLAAGLLLVLLATAAALGRRRPARASLPSTGPALAAFLRYDGRLGFHRRQPHESLRELQTRLPPEVADALRVVEQECYGATAPDARAAVEVLDATEPGAGSTAHARRGRRGAPSPAVPPAGRRGSRR